MKMKLVALVVSLLLLASLSAAAQGLTLGQTKTAPTVDGVIGDGEYAQSMESGSMKLSLSWVGDALFIAVSGQTSGWVAVGLGSPKMNDAVMYIGAADSGKGQLKVQKGAGHRHADVDTPAPSSYALREAGGQTVMELSVPASAFIAAGQKQLDVIYAMGGAKVLSSMHKARYAAQVSLAK
ncbi:MAG: hypothetical protein ABSG63_16350 [Spirochaetia bacterium]|jgi:hypothetical protein